MTQTTRTALTVSSIVLVILLVVLGGFWILLTDVLENEYKNKSFCLDHAGTPYYEYVKENLIACQRPDRSWVRFQLP